MHKLTNLLLKLIMFMPLRDEKFSCLPIVKYFMLKQNVCMIVTPLFHMGLSGQKFIFIQDAGFTFGMLTDEW